jgi:hypothetical protein
MFSCSNWYIKLLQTYSGLVDMQLNFCILDGSALYIILEIKTVVFTVLFHFLVAF